MSDPFAPISGGKPNLRVLASEHVLVAPVPSNAPKPPERHPRLGACSAKWTYLDAAGELLGFACRFDAKGEKQFRPLALYRSPNGSLEWRWESWPAPRPLYGLDRLAERTDADVIVCEGEKSADAAARLLPSCVVVTSPNGAKSAAKADWAPLRGRRVIIWPDADDPGRKYAETVAGLAYDAGAASVAIAATPAGVKEGWDAADAADDGWTQERAAALIDAADPVQAPARGGAKNPSERGGRAGKQRRTPQRDLLSGLTEACDFWHGLDGVAYVTFPIKDHRENWKVRSPEFKRWLTCEAYGKLGQVPGGQAVEDALRFLEGRAINDGPQRKPWLRVGESGGNWLIDLGDPKWRVVEIRKDGWAIRDRHDLPMVRSRPMMQLPTPELGGNVYENLQKFVNVRDDDSFKAVVAWLLAALRPRGPYPVLLIQGEQGSGKSVLSRLLRSIIDPNQAPIRTPPKDEEDLLISAKNGHLIALDNVSKIDPIMADALCRVATGGGFSTRVKYTNDEEYVVHACNPILANGIPSMADRPDLASRALVVHLTAIPDDVRQPEEDYLEEWNQNAPFVFGALCDALSGALARLPTVRLARASRMADFEKLIVAASPALGWEPDDFSAVYAAIQRDLGGAAFEADPVAVAITRLIAEDYPGGWTGTATRLLELLAPLVSEGMKRSRVWPQTAQGLGNRLDRATPLLRQRGITVERRHSGARLITIAPANS